ncbi:MAG: hypothetical protein NUV67_04925 [archaeon]|nr:hypothetical protein [archaeon]
MNFGREFFLLVLLAALAFLPQQIYATTCGNSVCEEGENSCLCPGDCGTCSGEVSGRRCSAYYCTPENICGIEIIPNCCGNEVCEEADSYFEDFGVCPSDCEPRNVNLTPKSPVGGGEFTYGENVFLKVVADADGRSIAGIEIIAHGPFGEIKLHNDGVHGDDKPNDNVFGANARILSGSLAGDWNVSFFTSFRNIDGNAIVPIKIDPRLGVILDAPADAELGDNVEITGTILAGKKGVSVDANASLYDPSGAAAKAEQITSDANGLFAFSYRSTFVDKIGGWIFVLKGADEFGNTIDANVGIEILRPGETPEREIVQVKEIDSNVVAGEKIEVALRVIEEGTELGDARVVADAFGQRQELFHLGNGIYGGVIEVPANVSGENLIAISVFSPAGGKIVSANFPVFVGLPGLTIEVVSPQKKLFKVGEEVIVEALVTLPGGMPADGASVFGEINGKKFRMENISPGVYSGTYEISPAEKDEIGILVIAQSEFGPGASEKKIFVSGASEYYGAQGVLELLFWPIVLVVALAIISVPFLLKRFSFAKKKDALDEIDRLEKRAQELYFHKKSINKEEYDKLMQNYSKKRREL